MALLGGLPKSSGGQSGDSPVENIPPSFSMLSQFSKSKVGRPKAVPLHAVEALEGTGGIAPTHSRPRY
jgi:hypothetical protein